jgi:hypothetical protein
MTSRKGSAGILGPLLFVASAGCGLFLGDPKQGPSDAGVEVDGSNPEAQVDGSVPPDGGDDRFVSYPEVGSDTQAGADAQVGSDTGVATDSASGGDDGATRSDASSAVYVTSCSMMGSGACTCAAPDPGNPGAANSTECDSMAVQGSVCCADPNWPEPGSTCTCLTASCTHPAGGGCDCTLGSDGQSCNDGVVCCVAPSPQSECLCTYGVSTCWDGYRTAPQGCNAPAIGCGANSQLSSCSIPAGK